MTLDKLKPRTRCRVVGAEPTLSARIMEMGLLPGAVVEVLCVAPLGDPIALRIDRNQLAIRRSEASQIRVGDLQSCSR